MAIGKAQLASRIKNKILAELLEKINNHLLSPLMDDYMVKMKGADWYNPSKCVKPQQIEIKTDKGNFNVTINVEPIKEPK